MGQEVGIKKWLEGLRGERGSKENGERGRMSKKVCDRVRSYIHFKVKKTEACEGAQQVLCSCSLSLPHLP